MNHNTHIYIARKAIDFLYDALANLRYTSGRKAAPQTIKKLRQKGKVLQRLLNYHESRIIEASWAPDDIINDKVQYHTFKLYSENEFTDGADYAKESHAKDNTRYFRASGGGGLPYKVDHLSRFVSDMLKLRDYNDSFSMEQIMYQFFLLSHYVIDAHVPMHCDIRDDEPSDKKPSGGLYYDTKWHARLEKRWDEACTPVGFLENILDRERAQDNIEPTDLSPLVSFNFDNSDHINEIKTYTVQPKNLMKYMINLCIKSKERSLRLFPVDDPDNFQEDRFGDLTRRIFADSIGNLISIWICIYK